MYKKDTYTYTYSCTHDQAVDVLINDVKALGFYPKETKATDDDLNWTQRGVDRTSKVGRARLKL